MPVKPGRAESGDLRSHTISAVEVAAVTSKVVTNRAATQVEKVRTMDAVIFSLLKARPCGRCRRSS